VLFRAGCLAIGPLTTSKVALYTKPTQHFSVGTVFFGKGGRKNLALAPFLVVLQNLEDFVLADLHGRTLLCSFVTGTEGR